MEPIKTILGGEATSTIEATTSRPLRQKEKMMRIRVQIIHTMAYSSRSLPFTISRAIKIRNRMLAAMAMI